MKCWNLFNRRATQVDEMLIVSLDPKGSSGITKLDQSKLANDADLGSSNLKLLGSQGGEKVLIDKSEEEKE